MPAVRPKPFPLGGQPLYEIAMNPRHPVARRLRLALTWVGVLVGSLALAAAEAPKTSFDVAGGDAAETLRQLARQARESIVFPIDRVRGVRTNPLQGEFTARDAAGRMTAGTELFVSQDPQTGALLIGRRPDSGSEVYSNPPPSSTIPMKQKSPLGALRALFFLAAPLGAQTAPTVPAGSGAGDVVVLSPYEVDGSNDSRYRAANTLAGSRLNTELKDVSSVIDVFTKAFMADLGALELQDVAVYANNLEQDTEDTRHGLGNVQVQAWTSFNFRVRGLAASRSRNYFDYRFEFDSYNIERLDEARGPNAILFGFGSPGGIINSSTKRANVVRNRYATEGVVGDRVKFRGAVDLNQVLVKDRWALRLNAMHHEEEGWIKWTHKDKEAWNLTTTVRPFRKTNLMLEYEDSRTNDEQARPYNYHDRTLVWDAAGAPLVYGSWNDRNNRTLNPTLTATQLGTMAQVFSLNDAARDAYWVYNDNNGSILNFRGMARSDWPNQSLPNGTTLTFWNGGRTVAMEPAGVNWVNVMGPSAGRDIRVRNESVIWQQELTRNLHLEAAFLRSRIRWDVQEVFGSVLDADPNAWLPAGTVANNLPNPNAPRLNSYAGLAYFDSSYNPRINHEATEDGRISASYELALQDKLAGRWGRMLGRHRLAGLYEESKYTLEEVIFREQILINGQLPRPDLPGDTRNRFNRRHYITDPTNPFDYVNGSLLSRPPPVNATLADGSIMTTAFHPYQRRYDYTRNNTSKMFAMQNFWWGGRLVTTYGKRQDEVTFHAYNQKNDGLGGVIRDPASLTHTPYSGSTRLIGGVFHLTPRLSVFYNDSDSIGVPLLPIYYVPDGRFNSPTVGAGTDYGLKVALLDDRVSILATRFKSGMLNDVINSSVQFWVTDNQDRILNALVNAGLMTTAQTTPYRVRGNGLSYDSVSEGYELAVTGRVRPNWEFRLNYSWSDRNVTNVAPRIKAWAEAVARPFWATLDRVNPRDPQGGKIVDTVITSGVSTIRDSINTFEGTLTSTEKSLLRVIGLRRNKFNVFTSYGFEHGAAKGLRLGGGVRFIDAPVVGQEPNGSDRYGRSNLEADFFTSFQTKLLQRRVTFQVNVKNAFRDLPGWSPINQLYGSNNESIVVFPPREILFTTRIEF